MLRITHTASSSAAKSYFLKAGDYHLLAEGKDFVGDWHGEAAFRLGLSGTVDRESFSNLCDNVHPQTGERLTLRNKTNRRVGYDFTFSVPKSLSTLYAVTGDERIVAAMRLAVADTMNLMEREAEVQVKVGGKAETRTSGNWAWGEFVHHTTRPIKGVPDPQLHVHAFAPNVSYDPVERRYKAIEVGKIKEQAPYFQAAYLARLAELTYRLGYDVARSKSGFEVAGVPESANKKFSRRTSLIESVADRLGIRSEAAKAKLGATTRERKEAGVKDWDTLTRWWKSQLTDSERQAIESAHRTSLKRQGRGVEFEDGKWARFAVDHLLTRNSVVPSQKAQTEALKAGVGRVTAAGVTAALDHLADSGKVIRRDYRGTRMLSTPAVLAEERDVLALAREGRNKHAPLARPKITRDFLNDGQRNAVEHALTNRDFIALIRGAAGTGKTTLLTEIVDNLDRAKAGYQLLAPTSDASRNTLAKEVRPGATTVASYLASPKQQRPDTLLIVDEAGLAGFQEAAKLVRLAHQNGNRILLVGDRRQHRAVNRGEPLAVLEDMAGLPVAEVKDIQRQKGQWKKAAEALAAGENAKGFRLLDAMGAVKEAKDYSPVIREYVEARKAGKSVLMTCPTHAEGAVLSGMARAALKKEGSLAQQDREFTRLVPLHLTAPEQSVVGVPQSAVLQFHQRAGRRKPGERVSAAAATAAERTSGGAYQAYERQTISLAVGDSVRVTASGKDKTGKHRLYNGNQYTVSGFTRSGDIKLHNGWVLDKEFGHLRHDYVSTSIPAQGRSVDRVIAVATRASLPAVHARQSYVDWTRGKEASVYTDDKQALLAAAQWQDARLAAVEVFGEGRPRPAGRLRKALARAINAVRLWRGGEPQQQQQGISKEEQQHER